MLAPAARMSEIFISYRRGADSPYARGIYDRLAPHFGRDRVFMDIDTMEPGIDFVEYIHSAVASCDVLVAVIGRDWISAVDEHGQRRLEDEDDFVRQEVSAALEREDVRVIPVLVGGATMPPRPDLPGTLGDLRRRNALELSDNRWSYDVGLLIDAVEKIVGPAQAQPTPAAKEPAEPKAEEAPKPEPKQKRRERKREETPAPPPPPAAVAPKERSPRPKRVLAGLAAVVVLGAAVAGIVAASGGGGDSAGRLSHNTLVSKGDAECGGLARAVKGLDKPNPSSPAEVSKTITEYAGLVDGVAGKLRNLRPPAADETALHDFVDKLQSLARQARKFASAVANVSPGASKQELLGQVGSAPNDLANAVQEAQNSEVSLGLSGACTQAPAPASG